MNTENEKVNVEASEAEQQDVGANAQESMDKCEETVSLPERAKVEKVIRESVYASMGIGIVPFSLFNVAGVTASNLNLARRLSNLYGVEFKEGAAKKIIAAITGAGASVLASPLVQMAVIGVPLVGLPLAIGTAPILNGMTTYALGQMFVTHFERGGNFVAANMDAMKEDFSAAYKNSREWIGDTIGGKKKPEAADA